MPKRPPRRERPRPPLLRRPNAAPVRLDDGGPEVSLDPTLFGIDGRDRSWNRHAQAFLNANAAPLSLLDVQAGFAADADEVRLVLRPGGTVGAVPLFSPVTRKVAGSLVISPRFGWSGIGPVLQRVGWSSAPELLRLPAAPGSAREVPPWVLAGPIIGRLAALLRHDRRAFRETIETRHTPRGQVLWDRYASGSLPAAKPHHLPCRYSDLQADEELRAYIRWGLESVRRSLLPWQRTDPVCRSLLEQTAVLVTAVGDVATRSPARATLDRMSRKDVAAGEEFRHGLEALGWLVDERGLAGPSEPDGLSWRMAMHELFERWVESVSAAWAAGIGGTLRSGRRQGTIIPIRWRSGAARSLSHLTPDITIERDDRIWIIDAKYKGHFEELDDSRWYRLRDELREAHRHDLHQILAYAAAHATKRVVCVLAYPMRKAAWDRLAASGSAVSLAAVESGGRGLTLALAGVPLDVSTPIGFLEIVAAWNRSLMSA